MKRRHTYKFWRLFFLMGVIILGGSVALQSVGIDPIFALIAGLCVFAAPVYTQNFTIDGGQPTNFIAELLSKPLAVGGSSQAWLASRPSRDSFARAFRILHIVLVSLCAMLAIAFIVLPTESAGPVCFGIAFASLIVIAILGVRIGTRFGPIEPVE